MQDVDVDHPDLTPREVPDQPLDSRTAVGPQGWPALDFAAPVAGRDPGLDDPHGQSIASVRAIRGDSERRIAERCDEFAEECKSRD